MKTLNYSISLFEIQNRDKWLFSLIFGFFFLPIALYAQSFAPPISSPFGLPMSSGIYWQSLADIDNDGDIDYFQFNQSEQALELFENIGTPTSPEFDGMNGTLNPFGILKNGTPGASYWADMDNDGDLDFWWGAQFNGSTEGGFFYYQNLGTPENPMFGDPPYNPFGLTASNLRDFPTLVDIDNDDDYDMFSTTEFTGVRFFENNGTPEEPSFAAPVEGTEIGIPNFLALDGTDRVYLAFADLDMDLDFDLLACAHFFVSGGQDTTTRIYFIENIGTPEAFEFAAPVENPFGLSVFYMPVAVPQFADMDADGDIDLFISGSDPGKPGERIFYFENLTIVSVVEEEKLEVDVVVSPNPSGDWLNLEVKSDQYQDDLSYSIHDLFGNIYLSGKLNGGVRLFQKILIIESMPSGVYFVKIQSGNRFKVLKFEKI